MTRCLDNDAGLNVRQHWNCFLTMHGSWVRTGWVREPADFDPVTMQFRGGQVFSFRTTIRAVCQCRRWCTERFWDDVAATYSVPLAFFRFQAECVPPGTSFFTQRVIGRKRASGYGPVPKRIGYGPVRCSVLVFAHPFLLLDHKLCCPQNSYGYQCLYFVPVSKRDRDRESG
jgi:hypothetical protein